MRIFAGGWICLAVTCLATTASASSLVTEIEKLRDGLGPRDPARPALTLRLADTLFDETVRSERQDAPAATLAVSRRRAISLYQEALTGNGGVFAPIEGPLKTKIHFQMARLHTELAQSAEANRLWETILAQPALPELRREAALRLAEFNESSTAPQAAKKADALYGVALQLCNGSDLCSYVRYRRAWLMRRDGRESESLAEIKLALRDSKGQIREEALRDWIVFLGESRTDGVQAMTEVDELATQIGRSALLNDLAESFYSAGNKQAGMRVLELVSSRSPSLANQTRLLEDYYGVRDWDRFRSMLSRIPAAPAGAGEAESEKVMRRLIVQLDGERLTKAETIPDFQATVELYLKLYPTSSERSKMIEGWLAAEKDESAKVARLERWIAEEPSSRKLREMRAAAAQKSGQHAVVATEMGALAALPGIEPAKAREYRYLRARALYEIKDYAQALPLFESLAQAPATNQKVDQWALQSQHLALDILAQKKDLAGVRARAGSWAASAELTAEQRGEFAKISQEAAFESAVSQGQTPAALAEFKALCQAKTLLPKSCDNARILAVKLKAESDLIDVLRASGTPAELAAELEAAAYFAEAGELLEKQPRSTMPANLKVALMYELGGRDADRDRILNQVITQHRAKLSDAEEKLLLMTLSDAKLLNLSSLAKPWSQPAREQIAHELEAQGRGDARTRTLVLKASRNLGPAWERIALEELNRLNDRQKAIAFHGKNSKARFESRLAALKQLVNESERLLPMAGNSIRSQAWTLLGAAHLSVADEILKSPIPEGVSSEAVAELQSALAQMAQPFQEKAEAYSQLVAGLAGKSGSDQIAATQAAAVSDAERSAAIAALHRDPLDRNALDQLRNQFERQGAWRLAAYFEGRLKQEAKHP